MSGSEGGGRGETKNRRTLLTVLTVGLLPGVLAGIQLAGLLFFLNPHLPFEPAPFLRAALLYAGLLGLASLVAQLPLMRLALRDAGSSRLWRWLPWSMCLVFAVAATSSWVHASIFSFYLPSGINLRLIKAAIWLSLAALILFYTALLHSLNRRRYGPRSRIGIALVAVLSIYVIIERREAFRPAVGPGPRSSSIEPGSRPQLLFVGLPGATLDAVLPLAEQGRLPFLEKVLQQGAHGHLTSFVPTREAPLWTTLASGKYPYKHGVFDSRTYWAPFLDRSGRLKLIPVGLGFEHWGARPRPRSEAQVLSLWQILGRLGVPSTVTGWPGAHPAATSPAAPATLRTPDLPPAFGPSTPAAVFDSLNRDRADVEWVREQLQSRSSETPDPGLERVSLFIVLRGLAEVSKLTFGGYSAAQFDGRQQEPYQQAAEVLAAYYGQIDALIESVWEELEPPRLLVVVSAHGTRPARGLRKSWSSLRRRSPVEGYFSDAPAGVLLLLGEGISPGTFINRAGLTDVAPSLLYSLGFPVARDFDGRVLAEAFDGGFLARHPLTYVPSYETIRPRRSDVSTLLRP